MRLVLVALVAGCSGGAPSLPDAADPADARPPEIDAGPPFTLALDRTHLSLVGGAAAPLGVSVARNSIGIVLVGGMTIGTLFTLFVVPSLYVLIAADHQKQAARAAARADGGTPASEPPGEPVRA